MSQITQNLMRDASFVPIWTDGLIVSKTIAYDGTAGKGLSSASPTTLFTVTGDVIVVVFAICSEDLTSAGNIEVGISGNTAALIAQTTAANIDNGEVWVDTSPATVESLPGAKLLANGTDVIETISADVTDGTLTYYCLWRPLSGTSNVVAA